jgi:hypothetical protein
MKKISQLQVYNCTKCNGTFGLLISFFFFCLNSFGQNIQSSLTEIWTNNNWQNFSKQLNTYDSNPYLTQNLSQLWDVPSSSWNDKTQNIYANNPNGTVNQVLNQVWNVITSTWDNSQRETYSYNSSDKGTLVITE